MWQCTICLLLHTFPFFYVFSTFTLLLFFSLSTGSIFPLQFLLFFLRLLLDSVSLFAILRNNFRHLSTLFMFTIRSGVFFKLQKFLPFSVEIFRFLLTTPSNNCVYCFVFLINVIFHKKFFSFSKSVFSYYLISTIHRLNHFQLQFLS